LTFSTSALAGWPLEEARTAGGGQIRSSLPKISRFNCTSSVTASMTRSATAASSRLVEVLMRERIWLSSSALISPWAAKSSRLNLILSRAADRLAALLPMRTTRLSAMAKICATP
jgi:hypothetical protein